jgi:hypothetical protein
MRWKINRTWRVVLIVLVVLVAVRLALPYIVTRYVNKVLSELEGYQGVIEDVDIHLFRGAYQIHGLKIYKVDGNKEIPFIDIPLTDLSIEWEAIFQGAVVGEVNFDKPVLNFISNKRNEKTGKKEPADQAGKDVDWTEPIKKLMPVDINRLTIDDGKIAFYDFSTKPRVDLFMHHVQLDATNLNNAKDNPEELPSRIYLQALSMGNGQLNVAMKANVLKEVPDMDVDLRFENVDLKALNDFFQAYAKVDVEKGQFNLYSEIAVADGNITGYVKPLLNNLKVVDWKKDQEKPLQLVWESMVGFVTEIFENQKKDQFATRVPLQGHVSSVDTSVWPALWNIFSNAFVQAFDKNTDGTISIASAETSKGVKDNNSGEKKDKKELRKEKRKERRKERKERKAAKMEEHKADQKSSKTKGNS